MSSREANHPDCARLDSAILGVLLDALPDMVYLKDLGSRYVRINRAHARLLGIDDPAKAVGRTKFEDDICLLLVESSG